jgi:hypothetical protein
MTTPQKIIDTAFGWLAIKAAEEPLTAAMASDGLHQLNNFLAEEDAISVLKGIQPTENLDTDLQEPRYATGFLEANVAVKLAAFYGKQVSQSLAAEVVRTQAIVTNATLNMQAVEFPSTLPTGSGNSWDDGYYYNDDFFPEPPKENF